MFDVEKYKLVRLKKGKRGTWLLSVNFAALLYWLQLPFLWLVILWQLINPKVPQFNFLSKLKVNKLVAITMGLGLVIGVASQVFSNPDSSLANPTVLQTSSQFVAIKELSLPTTNLSSNVIAGEKFSQFLLLPSDQINQFETSGSQILITVGGQHRYADLFPSYNLGDEVVALSENGGKYHYKLIATKLADRSNLNQYTDYDANLVIIVPNNLLQTEFRVLLFK